MPAQNGGSLRQALPFQRLDVFRWAPCRIPETLAVGSRRVQNRIARNGEQLEHEVIGMLSLDSEWLDCAVRKVSKIHGHNHVGARVYCRSKNVSVIWIGKFQ